MRQANNPRRSAFQGGWPALATAATSVISGVEHVDRGYEAIESKLVALGAKITRIDAWTRRVVDTHRFAARLEEVPAALRAR